MRIVIGRGNRRTILNLERSTALRVVLEHLLDRTVYLPRSKS